MGFIKYPTNCFLCFNIKNVITFSVIFNTALFKVNSEHFQGIFDKKTLKRAKIEVLRFRYELRYEQTNEISFALRNLSNSGFYGPSRPYTAVLVRRTLTFKYSDNPVSCHAQTH